MRTIFAILLILAGIAAAAVYLSAFIVRQTEQAIVLEFGKPVDVINEYKKGEGGMPVNDAGLYWKIPVVQTVEFYDKRILDLDAEPLEVIASDQKRLVVDAFSRFRIVNPLLFYQTVRDERIARQRLNSIIESALRNALGGATFQDVVRDKREELMLAIQERANREAQDLGIEVVDVRIKRADLPEANSEAIYRRMQTERQREATEIRSEGNAAANRIRATADREATVIIAEATKKGEILRGEGDAERNQIYADAYGKDEDFFSFYRSMQAYEKGMSADDTRLLMSPDSQFFEYFSNPKGTPPPASPAGQPAPAPSVQ